MFKRLLIPLLCSFGLLLSSCGGNSSGNSDDVSITISPETVTLAPQAVETFTVTVEGSDDKTVSWEASGGTLVENSASATYTAPAEEGEYTVTATSQADTTKSATATVTVAAGGGVSVTLSPPNAELEPGGTATFTATVLGTDDTTVTWDAPEGGTLNTDGLSATYTAPAEEGEYTVTATSQADTTKSATATVTVAEGGEGPEPPSDPVNNAALLSGDAVGSGAVDNASLRKELSVTLLAENPDFSIGAAYAAVARESDKESRLYWMMTVTNRSDALKCFVELPDIVYKGAANAILGEEGKVKAVVGTAGVNDIGTLSTSCLAPDATGYFVGLKTDITFNQIESLEIPSINTSLSEYTVATLKVIPQSYSVAEAGSSQDLSIEVKNEGAEDLSVDDNQVAILLAEDDSPLFWDFMKRLGEWDGALAAGETQSLGKTFFRYEGTSSKMYVALDASFTEEPEEPEEPEGY